MSARQARHQALRRATGLCSCGQQPRPGRTKCAKCAAAANRNAAERMRAYRARKKAGK